MLTTKLIKFYKIINNLNFNNNLQFIWFFQNKFIKLNLQSWINFKNLNFVKKKIKFLQLPQTMYITNSIAHLFYHTKNNIYFGKLFFKYVNKNKFFLWRRLKTHQVKFIKSITQPGYRVMIKKTKLFKNIHTLITPLNYVNPKEFVIKKICKSKFTWKKATLESVNYTFHKQFINKSKIFKNTKVFLKMSNHSQLNFKNLIPFHNSTKVSLYLKKFRLITSRFLKYDINQVSINYNLRRVRRSSKLLSLKKRKFFNSALLLNSNQLPVIKKNNIIFNNYIKKFRKRFSKRRVDMFWVSKINQKSLTPSRRNYKIINRKDLIRQKRTTKFITRYYNFKVLNTINCLEFTLLNILMRSGLVNYKPTALILVNKNFLYLNFKPVSKPNILMNKNDILQLILSLKFILYIKWTTLDSNLTARRFFFYLRKWRNRKFRPYPKKSSYRIPNWVRRRLIYKEPTSAYVETDLLSFTSIVIYDWTVNFFNYHYMSLWADIPAVVRPLNWKSLT